MTLPGDPNASVTISAPTGEVRVLPAWRSWPMFECRVPVPRDISVSYCQDCKRPLVGPPGIGPQGKCGSCGLRSLLSLVQ